MGGLQAQVGLSLNRNKFILEEAKEIWNLAKDLGIRASSTEEEVLDELIKIVEDLLFVGWVAALLYVVKKNVMKDLVWIKKDSKGMTVLQREGWQGILCSGEDLT